MLTPFFYVRSKRSISDDEQLGEDQDLNGDNTHLYGEEEVAEDDYDNARQQQRVEVALNMPALPIPDSKDGKVRYDHVSVDYLFMIKKN